jgi:hypothetical protein
MPTKEEMTEARFAVAVVKRLVASGYSESSALRVVNNHQKFVREMMHEGKDDCTVAIKLAVYEG